MGALSLTLLVIGIVILIGLLIYAFGMYNQLVRLNKEVNEAWSDIDVLLKQRSDEIPKLIDTTKEYMDYEEEVLTKITEARTKVQEADSPEEQAKADSMLENALGDLFAVAEDYPDLKASENFQQLQDRISSIEEQISDRREYYNETVNEWNIRIEQIPHTFIVSLVNSLTGKEWKSKELFEASEEEKEDVDISNSFDNTE